jgi:pectinesterase
LESQILGSTTDTTSYTSNSVTITHSLSAAAAGNDDLSGTFRVHKDNFAMYNVNVRNTVRILHTILAPSLTFFIPQFGSGSQALALSSYGTNVGYYGSAFFG